jgi:uracil-DNA glycosylase family 4
MTTSPNSSAQELLEWYQEMGVDDAVSDQPTDWFAQAPKPKATPDRSPPQRATDTATSPSTPPRNTQPRSFADMPPSQAAMDARERARSATDLDELKELLTGFDGCPLKVTAKNMCFARGSAAARIMFIGEAPGRDEDLQGIPFVGRAGQLLDKMLGAIGLSEDDVYITNVVYWRPPGNRTPTPQEIQACQPFLQRQIELIDPKVLVFLGGAAAKQMFATSEGIMRLRGKWRDFKAGDAEPRAIATLHPAYLLRNPVAKRLAWRDLLEIQAALEN